LSINKQVTLYNRTTYVSDLVCNTREGSSESGWAHLGELYGYHTPRTLNAKLHTESASGKRTEARRKNPEWNENTAEHDKQDDREPAADTLRNRACNGPAAVERRGNEYWIYKGKIGVRGTRDGSDITDDCCDD
jgi:hypothetical protein